MSVRDQVKEKAKAQWADRSRGQVDVPEWETTIYFKTPNLAMLKDVSNDSGRDPIESQARLVVACATDVNGERIWNKAEWHDLMTAYDPSIVSRIASAIMSKSSFAATPQEKAIDEKN